MPWLGSDKYEYGLDVVEYYGEEEWLTEKSGTPLTPLQVLEN